MHTQHSSHKRYSTVKQRPSSHKRNTTTTRNFSSTSSSRSNPNTTILSISSRDLTISAQPPTQLKSGKSSVHDNSDNTTNSNNKTSQSSHHNTHQSTSGRQTSIPHGARSTRTTQQNRTKSDMDDVVIPPKPNKLLKNKEEFSTQLRRLQVEWMECRVRRPFWSGMTSNGMNYIDTRPMGSDSIEGFGQEALNDTNAGSNPITQSNPTTQNVESILKLLNNGTVAGQHVYKPAPDNPNKEPFKPHGVIPETPLPGDRSSSPSSTSTNPTKPQGITIVMAHGYSFGYGMWSENFDAMTKLPGVNRVVAFDWRGMGGSLRHQDDGPLRSSLSLLEEYKHDTFVSFPQEEKINKDNQKIGKIKKAKCRQHFSHFFSKKSTTTSSPSTNDPNGTNPLTQSQQLSQSSSQQQDGLVTGTGDVDGTIESLPRHQRQIQRLIKSRIYDGKKSFTPQKSIDYFIDPLLTLFSELGLDNQPVVVVAHSLGGYLSTNFVHKYPGLAHTLILASPVGVCESYGLKHNYEFESFQQFAVSHLRQEEEHEDGQTHGQFSTQSTPPLHYFPLPVPPTLESHADNANNNDNSNDQTTKVLTATNQDTTTLGVSNTRLTKPLILRNPIIQLIHFLWQTNSTPQSLLRGLPTKASYAVSTSLASRMHPPDTLTKKEKDLFIDYLHHIFTAPPTGEHALNSLLHIDYPSTRAKAEWKQYKNMVKQRLAMINRTNNQQQSQSGKDGDTTKTGHTPHSTSLLEQDLDERKPQHPKHLNTDPNTTQSDGTDSNNEFMTDDDSDSDDFAPPSPKGQQQQQSSQQQPPPQQQSQQQQHSKTKPQTKKQKPPITPSVFARKPLVDILYDINIPTHFLFGSHDWLFHQDVPYIVGSLHQHFQQPQIADFLREKSMWTAFGSNPLEIIQGNDINSTMTSNNDHNNNKNNNIIDKIGQLWNLNPAVTLTMIPQSGHHLYVNNLNAFNLAVHNSVVDYAKKRPMENKINNDNDQSPPTMLPYDNSYSKRALSHYLTEYNKVLEKNRENKASCSITSLSKDNSHLSFAHKALTDTTVKVKHGLDTVSKHWGYLFGSIEPQSSQQSQQSDPFTPSFPTSQPNSPQNESDIASPLVHAVSSSLLSNETSIPKGSLNSNVCKYAKFIYFGKGYKYQGVNNDHFDKILNQTIKNEIKVTNTDDGKSSLNDHTTIEKKDSKM